MVKVELVKHDGDILTFTLSGLNVSLANALRRTIISDIKSVVFRTAPYEENKAKIEVNTTRLNNEILKQRLSCIPIHMKTDAPYQNYQLEINVQNTTDATIYVTTKDFVVRDTQTNQVVDGSEIFPPNSSGHYIDFVRLKHKISDEIPGEHLKLTCQFDVGSAKESGMFSQVSMCAYGNTVDEAAAAQALAKKHVDWKTAGNIDLDMESKNWKLLDGLRYYVPDSFDFKVQTIGVFTNIELVNMACDTLVERLRGLGEFEIKPSLNTLKNSYDIILKNDDYTIGKTLEWLMYSKYFDNPEAHLLSYCGFKKMHPHDKDSILRVGYVDPVVTATVQEHLASCIDDAVTVFQSIKTKFPLDK